MHECTSVYLWARLRDVDFLEPSVLCAVADCVLNCEWGCVTDLDSCLLSLIAKAKTKWCVCVWLDWVGSGQAEALRAIKDFGKQYCLNFWGERCDTADKRFSPRKTNIPVLWPNLTAAVPTTNGRGLSYTDRAKIAAIWSRCILKGHNGFRWKMTRFYIFMIGLWTTPRTSDKPAGLDNNKAASFFLILILQSLLAVHALLMKWLELGWNWWKLLTPANWPLC